MTQMYSRPTRRGFLARTGAVGAMISLHPFTARATENQSHLRILSTTDLHVHVFPYDYYGARPTDSMGLSRTASLIEAIRAEAGNTMLVDTGDFLQGNPMGDFAAQEHGRDHHTHHPMITALNALSPDAATVGNHEFNYGLSFLKAALADASYPIVSANLLTRRGATVDQDETLLPPYIVLDRSVADGQGGRLGVSVAARGKGIRQGGGAAMGHIRAARHVEEGASLIRVQHVDVR